ncbi:MAG: carboxypeptidase regulatory-like domain-containing protein [Sedimentisphaerales bacterium]|nr:carboxypeptidase regulatory-like domain-containing protein [Sedimentisphaerales bacterium]
MKSTWLELMVSIMTVFMAAETALAGAGGAAGSNRTLTFRVVSRETREPLAGVNLQIRIGNETSSEITNEQGQFRIEYGPEPPEYLSVRASKEGLVPVQAAWRLTEPSVTLPDKYTLAMEPGTTIGGIIQNEQGEPIEGATVYLLVPSDSASGQIERISIYDHPVTTDARGCWRCDIMPAKLNEIWIRLAHPDYVSDEMFGSTPKPPLEKLRDLTGVMIMKKGVTVTGRVLDADGRPIADATVAQGSDRFGTHYPSTTTDAEGRFKFANAEPTQMILTVQASGYAPDLKQIAVNKDLEPVEFRLARGRTLRGRVVDPQGDPIAGAFVAADKWRGHRSLRWRVDTDADGRFQWDEAPSDEVLIDMGKRDYMSVRRHGLTASEQEYTITMHPVLRVKGRVVDEETGVPIPAFTTYPGIDWGNGQAVSWQRRSGTPCADGAFEMTFSEPRLAHLILVEAEGYLPGVSRRFEDTEGQVTYDFSLKKGRGLSGTVRQPDGRPAVDTEVILCTPSRALYISNGRNLQARDTISVQTGEAGRFSFPPQADPYCLVAISDAGYAQVSEEDLKASPDVTLQPWGRIEGKVMIGSQPGVGETVRVSFDRPSETTGPRVAFDCSAVGDKDGGFVLDRVPAGQARISREVRISDRMSAYTHSSPIEIKSGQTTTVTVGGMGRPVVGRVAIPDPVRDKIDWTTVECSVRSQSPQSTYRLLRATVERDGSLRADDVPAGDYCLHFSVYTPATTPRGFRGELLGSLVHPFTVPEMPGGRSDDALDLGLLTLPMLGGRVSSPYLVGRPVPDLSPFLPEASLDESSGKPLLICFFDMQQRPSRNTLLQLTGQAESLREKGVAVIAIHTSEADQAALDEWVSDNNIPFRVGAIPGDEQRTRSAWGIQSLPWLVLTNRDHAVVAEGFSLGELGEKLTQ